MEIELQRGKPLYALIADVHGSWIQFQAALNRLGFWREGGNWYSSGAFFVISLGDLNDYRHDIGVDVSSSLNCMLTMKELQEKGWGITVQSNHQDKLLRFLKGHEVKLTWGLDRTVAELTGHAPVDLGALSLWLESLPLFYEFEEDNIEYVAAHAYWSDRMGSNAKTDKSLAIYGPRNGADRDKWWENYPKQKRIPIVGHYHESWLTATSIGIDDGCGEGGPLNIYIPSKGETISIPFTM